MTKTASSWAQLNYRQELIKVNQRVLQWEITRDEAMLKGMFSPGSPAYIAFWTTWPALKMSENHWAKLLGEQLEAEL